MFRRLLARLGYEPRSEAEGMRHLKRLAEQLNERGGRYRVVAERVVMLTERVELLDSDWQAWERRSAVASAEMAADVARICGRLEGQLQESRAELALLRAEEVSLHQLLTTERQRFAELVERARALGHDTSGCLLYVDLSRPDRVADETLLADDERSFLARVIDSVGVH